MQFLFDYGDEWQFPVEFERVGGNIKGKRYPLLLGEFGQALEQYPDWDEEDDEDDSDVITTVLSWDEAGELEIAVDLGLSEEGTYLQINGIEIRPEREALEKGLVEAFRDELDL